MALTFTGNILSQISFCDKQCSNVNDNKVKAQIVDIIDKKYGIQIISKDYNLVNPNILRNISYHQHILTPYTHGNPYMLYLTKVDNINCAIFIDKKLKDGYTYPKMHCVKYRFSEELYEKDTIFTGELVRDNERRWFFLIDNLLLYKGMKTNEKNILSRFELIYKIMDNDYTTDKYLEICPLYVKKLFLYKDVKKMVEEFIPNLSYMCKGIVFYTLNNKHSNYLYMMPRDSQIPIKSSSEIDDIVQDKYPDLWEKKQSSTSHNEYDHETNEHETNENDSGITIGLSSGLSNDISNTIIFESNSNINNNNNTNSNINIIQSTSKTVEVESVIEHNNVVFKVLKTDIPDIYNLYCLENNTTNNNNLLKHSIALIPNIKISHNLYYTFNSKPNNLGLNMECKFSIIFQKWIPIKFVDNTIFNKNSIEDIENKLKVKEED
jgi:hypothetical protein